MVDRRTRRAGLALVEAALMKLADSPFSFSPPTFFATPGNLSRKKSLELGSSVSANATVPKIVTSPGA